MNDRDIKEVYAAGIKTLFLVSLPWIVFLIEQIGLLDGHTWGLHAKEWKGLFGVFTFPFLHGDINHLMSNTPSLFLLIFGLFLFYEQKGWFILLWIFLTSGLLTWIMGREDSVHVGASGLVYALAGFHFVSGMIRKVPRQMAFSLLVAFLYGGFVWAFFPSLYANTSISWEGHLSGMLTGITFAFYFRNLGPSMPVYPFLEEEEENKEEAYWMIPEDEAEGLAEMN